MNPCRPILRIVTTLLIVLTGTLAASDARAGQNRFCGRFNTSYWDSMSGQDQLVSSPQNANKHWAVVKRLNPATAVWETVWGPDYMTGNCTGFFDTPGVTVYDFRVTSAVRIASGKYLYVYPDTNEQWLWYSSQHSLFSNPFGDVTTTVTWTAGEEIHVSLVGSVMGSAELAANTTYEAYAQQGCAGGLSCFNGTGLFLGTTAQTGSDAYSKSVIGHEMGHYVQHKLFGTHNRSYSQNATQALCICDHVDDPNDRAHCLQSREQVGAARLEGWGHFYASRLYNTPADSTAPFGYYKNFLNPGPQLLVPPVNANALSTYQWMESFCSTSSAGTEIDWMGFFYYLHTRTANSYSFANFNTVIQQECGGICNSTSDIVSWSSLQAAANAVYGVGSAKANHLINTGNSYGVDH